MKKIVALLLIVITVLFTFCACGDEYITDKEGNTHVALKEKGEYVQDKYGNLIEEIENDKGEKVTQPFTYPEMMESKKNQIENAYFKIDVPSGWTYDENLKIFRIQHKSDENIFCEIQFDSHRSGDVEVIFDNSYATELKMQMINEDLVKDVEKYETKLFDKDMKCYSCKYTTGSTVYFYAFQHAYTALSIKFILSDECKDEINPEEFIKEYITLKNFE